MKTICKIICAVLLLTAGFSAYGQNTKAYEAKKARLEKEIAIIDKQLAANASKSSSTLSDLTLIRKNIANRKALVAEADRKVRQYADSVYLAQREINRLQVRIDELKDSYAKLVLSAYKNRDARVWYMYMLASDNLAQAFRRFGYFKKLSEQMKEEAVTIKAMQDDLKVRKERLSQMKKDAEKVKNERVVELERLKKDEAKANGVVKQLKKDRHKYEKQLASKKKEVTALNKKIADIIAQAMKSEDPKKPGKTQIPVDMKLDGEFSNNKGKLPWPADGPVIARFGKQYHPVFKNIELPLNNGVDIAVPANSAVQSVFDGVVKQALSLPGYNQCVLVQHGGYFTLYCKMKTLHVKTGDKIKAGDLLGVIDTINGQTQLHFEVWKGKTPQNPEHWLR